MPTEGKSRAHANCCPPMGEEVFGSRIDPNETVGPSRNQKILQDEIIHFNLADLGVGGGGGTTTIAGTHAQRIYIVPNRILDPALTPENKTKLRLKKIHVKHEKQIAANNNEKKIRGLSSVYKLPVPVYTGKYHTPEFDSGYYPRWKKLKMEKEQPVQNSSVTTCKSATYTEFVGKISYLCKQSRKKMALYSRSTGNRYASAAPSSHSSYVPESGLPPIKPPSTKQSVFGKKQISIAGAVRKLLAIEEAKQK